MRNPTSTFLTAKTALGKFISKFYNKLISFTGLTRFNPGPEDYVNIPGVTTPTGVVLQKAFEDINRKVLFKKIHSKSIKLYLRNVILMDSQSTMYLFCNTILIENIYNAMKYIPLNSNGGKRLINHKSQVDCYKTHV